MEPACLGYEARKGAPARIARCKPRMADALGPRNISERAMSNVIRFPTSISDDEVMRLEMLDALKLLTEQAERGELKALLMASVSIPDEDADDMRIESWTFDGRHTPLLIGVGSWAVHRLNMRMEYSDDD